MKDAFNAKSFFDPQKIIAILLSDRGVKEKLREVGKDLLPLLSLGDSMLGRMMAKPKTKSGYNSFKAKVESGALDAKLEGWSKAITSKTKDEIRDFVESKLDIASDETRARARAEKLETNLADLSEDEYAKSQAAVFSVLPPLLKKTYETLVLQGQSVDAHARAFYNMTVDERVAAQMALAARVPVEAIVDAAYDSAQKVTPAVMKGIMTRTLARVSADDVWAVADPGMTFAKEVLRAAAQEDRIAVKNVRNAEKFGQQLQKILTVVEEEVVAAAILPGAAFEKTLRDAFAKNAAKAPKPSAGKKPKNDGPSKKA